MPNFNPHPDSLAMKSAQHMADARAIQEMFLDMQKRPNKRCTADEKVKLRAIINRMPADLRERCRPICTRMGISL